MTKEDRFVLYCIYYAQSSNSNIANLINGVLKLDAFSDAVKRLEDMNYVYNFKINPKIFSKVQSLSRFGDDPAKMRLDLFLINLHKSLDRISKENIILDSDLRNKITSLLR